MSINLSDDMRQALKAGDKKKLSALRLLVSALRQKEIDERRELGEEEQKQLLARLAKQRQESIAQFKTAERQDLVDKEQYELDLIRSYLPQPQDAQTHLVVEADRNELNPARIAPCQPDLGARLS